MKYWNPRPPRAFDPSATMRVQRGRYRLEVLGPNRSWSSDGFVLEDEPVIIEVPADR